MTLLEKIDTVLTWLYTNSGKNPDLQELKTTFLSKIDIGEITDILMKLYDDGLIRCEYGGDKNAKYHPNGHFLISFDGKYFCETVGNYTEKIKRENSKIKSDLERENRIDLNTGNLATWTRNLYYGTVAVAAGTGLLFVLGVLNLLKDLHWFPFCGY